MNCLGLLSGRVKFFGEDLRDERHPPESAAHGMEPGCPDLRSSALQGVPDNSRFYFVHSYYVTTSEIDQVAGRSVYGGKSCCFRGQYFCYSISPGEKSHVGLTLLRNFLTWNGASDRALTKTR